jgi:ADP-heptose:LPS heptosyltransferase
MKPNSLSKPPSPSVRLLLIRFSSFGDIVQAQPAAQAFRSLFPAAVIHWLIRRDFRGLVEFNRNIDQVIAFDRNEGLLNLLKLSWRLGAEPYSHIYDAHNNVRSTIVLLVILLRRLFNLGEMPFPSLARRSKDRVRRFMFFKLKVRSALKMPFRGVESFLRPMRKWSASTEIPSAPQFFIGDDESQKILQIIDNYRPDIALVPSAAWELKRWPVSSWQKLIELLPDYSFAILGGPEDSFCKDLAAIAPGRVRNFAGQLSLQGSSALLQLSRIVVSGDTGLLHVADQLGKPTLALIGPTAFGYPAQKTSETIEVDLPCKPCSKDGRGACSNPIYQKCMLDITPERVAERVRARLQLKEASP